jgi:hypothetical protein
MVLLSKSIGLWPFARNNLMHSEGNTHAWFPFIQIIGQGGMAQIIGRGGMTVNECFPLKMTD